MTVFMGFPFVKGLISGRGAPSHSPRGEWSERSPRLASARQRSPAAVSRAKTGGWCRDCTHAAVRLTRFSGPGHYCSANHPKWAGWRDSHPRPPPSEGGRLLLTLHPAFFRTLATIHTLIPRLI